VRLDDPLFSVGIDEYDCSPFASIAREDLSETWKIGADECSAIWVSSRTFRDAVLYRGVEPPRGEDAARCSSVFA
jgi:hypothetical protein